MGATASQITSLTIVYSTVYSGADQRKHQSSESLPFVRGIHRWPVNYPHKWPVTREMFPFDDVLMSRPFSMSILVAGKGNLLHRLALCLDQIRQMHAKCLPFSQNSSFYYSWSFISVRLRHISFRLRRMGRVLTQTANHTPGWNIKPTDRVRAEYSLCKPMTSCTEESRRGTLIFPACSQ